MFTEIGKTMLGNEMEAKPVGFKILFPFLFCVFVYLYIVFIFLDYQHAWIIPEAFIWKQYILETGKTLLLSDIPRALDTLSFELSSRSTRPLSELLEIFDTKFRVWLWQSMPPHPSLSLTMIFALIFSPILLYKLLRGLKISSSIALFSVALFLATPAFLSTFVMLLRPAKALTNFSFLLILLCASILWEKTLSKENPSAISGKYILLLSVMFFSFFWDETAIFIYPVALILFPKLFWTKGRRLLFLSLPLLYLLFQLGVLPILSHWAGFPKTSPLDSNIVQPIGVLPDVKNFPWHFYANTKLLIFENLGLFNPLLVPSLWGKLLFTLNIILVVLFIVLLLRGIKKSQEGKQLLQRMGVCLVAIFFFHYYTMSLHSKIWGPYWYGAYSSIFLVLFLAISARFVPWKMFALVTVSMVCSLLYLFPYTNYAYKKFHYYPYNAIKIRDVFLNKINRFTLTGGEGTNKIYEATRYYWRNREVQKESVLCQVPKELFYIPLERLLLTEKIPIRVWDNSENQSTFYSLPMRGCPTKEIPFVTGL